MKTLLLAAALALAAPASGSARAEAPEAVEVIASPITHFRLGSGETRFGDLEFVGGLELRSPAREFGQLSALRFLTPGGEFVGVADHGTWFFGSLARDGDGVPAGIENFRMQRMVDPEGRPLTDKAQMDAEGLEIRDGIATASFEREARVSEYRLGEDGFGPPLRDLDFVIPRRELRYNQGIETVLRTREGARVVISERSIDLNGDIFAAIIEGPEKGVFKIRRSDSFDITDGALLPDGDLLLLERRFSTALGVAVRLRRIPAGSVRKGALADGPVLMQADLGYRIDNMEAIEVWTRDDGATMVSLVSDDNQSFLQRTLYLEFRLVEDEPAGQ